MTPAAAMICWLLQPPDGVYHWCQRRASAPCQNTSTTPGEDVVADGSPTTGFGPIGCGPFQPDAYQWCATSVSVAFQNTSMVPSACAAACDACRELQPVWPARSTKV